MKITSLAFYTSLAYRCLKPVKNYLVFKRSGKVPITVIITTFNQPDSEIDTCVTSIMQQTLTKFNLLIIDDGSTNPETRNYLNKLVKLGDSRIKIFFQNNQGVVKARNAALKLCRTKYLVFLDPDDSISRTFLEKCYLAAESYSGSNLAITHTDVLIKGVRSYIWHTSEMMYDNLINQNTIPTCSLIRRNIFKKVGGYSNYMSDGFEDWECWIKMSKVGYRSFRIPEPLFKYTFSENSGRDFQARQVHLELHNKIKFYNSMPYWKVRNLERTTVKKNVLDNSFNLASENKRTVFIFVPWLLQDGGAENFLRTLAKGLSKNGRTVVFIATNYETSSGILDYLDVSEYVYDLSKFLIEEDYLKFIKNLLNRFDTPIVVNCGSQWLYENLEELCSFKGEQITSFDILFNEVGHFNNFISNQNLFNGVIPVHKGLEFLLTQELKVKSKVKRMPVGIVSTPILNAKHLNVRPKIGWIGRFSQEKCPELFIKSALESKVKADFYLAGMGHLFDEMKELSSDISNVKLLGRVDNNLEFLNSLDLLINTSSIEGIPLTAMEAISQGTPVIAPNIGGMSELIIDGQNGYLYDVDDFDSLISKIKLVVNTPGELARLQASTKQIGLPVEFHAETMIASFESIIN
jgi:glycosyltransferase involved in cell wall biosynthesis/GT2 family glycosyltransferase